MHRCEHAGKLEQVWEGGQTTAFLQDVDRACEAHKITPPCCPFPLPQGTLRHHVKDMLSPQSVGWVSKSCSIQTKQQHLSDQSGLYVSVSRPGTAHLIHCYMKKRNPWGRTNRMPFFFKKKNKHLFAHAEEISRGHIRYLWVLTFRA